jgi:hypothetical protein
MTGFIVSGQDANRVWSADHVQLPRNFLAGDFLHGQGDDNFVAALEAGFDHMNGHAGGRNKAAGASTRRTMPINFLAVELEKQSACRRKSFNL